MQQFHPDSIPVVPDGHHDEVMLLTQNFEIEPARMLELLEKELEAAKKKEQKEQSKKIKGAKA